MDDILELFLRENGKHLQHNEHEQSEEIENRKKFNNGLNVLNHHFLFVF